MEAKGRYSRGAAHYKAKLTEDDVLDIRSVHAFGATMYALAKAYGVDESNISLIVKRKAWRHLP